MTRRSSPQKIEDDRRFPIVVCFRVPEGGTMAAGIDPDRWLHKHIGIGQYAVHAAGRPGRDVFAVYFRRVGALLAFVDAHSALELADDVES